jgi:carbon storage regulator
MLVLTRKIGESIVINDDINVVVVSLDGNKCRLGIVAPPAVPVHRQEIYEKIKAGLGAPAILAFTGRANGTNSLAGELEAANATEFRGRNLVLDFTNVRRVNSAELDTLIGLHKRLASCGAGLTLICMDANVRGVFAVTRLDSFLAIRDGEEKARPGPLRSSHQPEEI